jgi:hypothetical protein
MSLNQGVSPSSPHSFKLVVPGQRPTRKTR